MSNIHDVNVVHLLVAYTNICVIYYTKQQAKFRSVDQIIVKTARKAQCHFILKLEFSSVTIDIILLIRFFVFYLELSNGISETTDDRIAALEEKTRLQDMEINILKSALSDVLTRLAAMPTNATAAVKKTSTSKLASKFEQSLL